MTTMQSGKRKVHNKRPLRSSTKMAVQMTMSTVSLIRSLIINFIIMNKKSIKLTLELMERTGMPSLASRIDGKRLRVVENKEMLLAKQFLKVVVDDFVAEKNEQGLVANRGKPSSKDYIQSVFDNKSLL